MDKPNCANCGVHLPTLSSIIHLQLKSKSGSKRRDRPEIKVDQTPESWSPESKRKESTSTLLGLQEQE